MSSINKDEALRAKDLAEGLMKKNDFTDARKLVVMAEKMDSSLENISRMLMVCDVHCAATETLFGNEMDWYGILQVELNANDVTIKKQYKKLALLLHPDKNKFPGAESAFKLIGEAQRTLLDREKRLAHDIKRRTWRKSAVAKSRAAPLYKTKQVPKNHTQPVYRANVNMKNVYNELKPENRHPQEKPQTQPAAFSHRSTFLTSCFFCQSKYEYHREDINRVITCQSCSKKFTAFETPFQGVPLAKNSCQTNFFVPQQSKFPGQKTSNEPPLKCPDNPANAFPRKETPPIPTSTGENNNEKKKKKRKAIVESSESSDGSSESEEGVIDDITAARDLGSSGEQQPRRSVRSKRQVIYNENLSDDDVDLVSDNGEGSGDNIDTEREEEPEDEKQADEDHQSTETLPNGINPKEKIKKDKVGSSAGASDSEEDLSAESEAKPNLINYADPDFNDFDKLREQSCFKVGQIWALYDEGEGMPRFYAVIKKVTTPNFLVEYGWLEAEEDEENETPDLPVSVGKFELGEKQKTNECNIFSHLIYNKTRSNARHFKVFPRKGETWTLFKNWNIKVSSDSDSPRQYEYEFVEILSDHAEGTAISVGFLSKVEGFSCVFRPMTKDGSDTCEIPPHEFFRFSHGVPSFRLKGTEGRGVIKGWYELDPAALPVPASQNVSGEEAAQDQDHQSPASGSTC